VHAASYVFSLSTSFVAENPFALLFREQTRFRNRVLSCVPGVPPEERGTGKHREMQMTRGEDIRIGFRSRNGIKEI